MPNKKKNTIVDSEYEEMMMFMGSECSVLCCYSLSVWYTIKLLHLKAVILVLYF